MVPLDDSMNDTASLSVLDDSRYALGDEIYDITLPPCEIK